MVWPICYCWRKPGLKWDITQVKQCFSKASGRTTQHVSPLYECTYGYHLYEEKPNLLIAVYTVLSTIERDKTFCTAIFYTSRANNANQ